MLEMGINKQVLVLRQFSLYCEAVEVVIIVFRNVIINKFRGFFVCETLVMADE